MMNMNILTEHCSMLLCHPLNTVRCCKPPSKGSSPAVGAFALVAVPCCSSVDMSTRPFLLNSLIHDIMPMGVYRTPPCIQSNSKFQ
jgi:hypothetical protein